MKAILLKKFFIIRLNREFDKRSFLALKNLKFSGENDLPGFSVAFYKQDQNMLEFYQTPWGEIPT